MTSTSLFSAQPIIFDQNQSIQKHPPQIIIISFNWYLKPCFEHKPSVSTKINRLENTPSQISRISFKWPLQVCFRHKPSFLTNTVPIDSKTPPSNQQDFSQMISTSPFQDKPSFSIKINRFKNTHPQIIRISLKCRLQACFHCKPSVSIKINRFPPQISRISFK